ncbi:MAG: hypothetical protein H0V29_01240 [Thermoleophilaceae bacterium]|nr:hypothetical protein [Thermoleophilaceae bacterium]
MPENRRQSRKRRRRESREDFDQRYRDRTEAKNEAARAELEPLEVGERPLAVTIGAVLSILLAITNVILWIAGVEVRGERQPLFPVLLFGGLLVVMGVGMLRMRYWAVLGMQALLGISLVILVLSVMLAGTIVSSLIIFFLVIIPLGALFWFLIKAMARIQMPERP